MSAECNDVLEAENRCSFARDHCEAFHVLHFCWLEESPVIYPVLIFLILFFIYLLGSTADQYFSPALARIADTLKLSPTIAGVSLLAFGNGAPDVFSSILAAKKLKVSLSIGGLFGGAIFVSCVVFGRVILAADSCKLDKSKTLRDCGLLIFTTFTIVFYGFSGTITFYQACLFPVLYLVYVALVLKMERKKEGLVENALELPTISSNYCQWGEVIDDYVLLAPEKVKSMPQIRYDELEWSQIKERFRADYEIKFSDLNLLQKTLKVLDYPFTVMRELTIPYYTKKTWNRKKAAAFPLCSSLFVLYSQNLFKTTVWGLSIALVLILAGVLIGILIFCTSKRTVLPRYYDQLCVFSFIMSILWIVAICEYMIDAISLIGLLFDLPVSFLGLTLLAWGNSAGDFVANPAITRLGMSQTAVTACFAGPLFNSLIGFGISLIVACWSKDVSFHILEHPQLIIASVSLVASNSVSVYVISNSAGNVRSAFGYLMIGVYLIFFCALLVYTLI